MRQKHTSCIKNIQRIHLPFVRSKVSSMALPQKDMYLPLKLLQRRKITICISSSLNYNSRKLALLFKFDMAFKTILFYTLQNTYCSYPRANSKYFREGANQGSSSDHSGFFWKRRRQT